MKIRIEIDPQISEKEIVIKCPKVDESITNLQELLLLSESEQKKIAFFKEDVEYYIPLEEILFFETSEDQIWAHTKDDEFSVKYKLYELESVLPKNFLRISKSAILNCNKVYSISKNLTASSLVNFYNSKKTAFVSRSYFKALKEHMNLSVGTKQTN